MKKSFVLAILGLTAAVSSYGQGSISFNTYLANGGSGIITTYASGIGHGTGTTPIGNNFTGLLLWSSVAINDTATTGPITAGSLLTAGWNIGSTATFGSGAAIAGYIAGPNLNIAAPVGVNLFFEIVAYSGAAYATAGEFSGHSAAFTGTLVTGTTLPSPNQLNGLVPFQVQSVVTVVPEPTTLALAGLGGLASLVMLRRKKA